MMLGLGAALAGFFAMAATARAAPPEVPSPPATEVVRDAPPAAAAAAEALTLEQALAMARARNRNLTAERAKLLQAQANVDQAWAALFPTVAAQGRYTRNYKEFKFALPAGELLIQPVDQLDGVVSASAPLLVPAAYPALTAVKAGAEAADANFSVTETSVLVAVAQTFYAASIADEVVAARASNLQVAQATLANARTRFSAGTVTKVDVDRAEIAVVRAQQGEREALFAQQKTYRALATLILADRPFRVRVAPVVPEPHDERDLPAALELRPEFRAIEATLRSADEQRKAQAWRWAPSLSAFGNARRFNYDNFARDRYSWAVGAQLDWVIYDGGTRDAQRHLAAAQATEAAARAEALRDTIRDELADGKRQLDTKRRGVEAAERSVTLARETLDLVRVQYEAGSVIQLDLLQAQDALVASQEALAQAHYDFAAAELALRRAAGTFPGK